MGGDAAVRLSGLGPQPLHLSDWLKITDPGVGTNRFAYAGNSPVNLSDPSGNVLQQWSDESQEYFSPNSDFHKNTVGGGPGAVAYQKSYMSGYSSSSGMSMAEWSAGGTPYSGGKPTGGASAGGLYTPISNAYMEFLPAIPVAYEASLLTGGVTVVWLQQNPDMLESPADGLANIHGNNLLSKRPTHLYHLINQTTKEIDEIGINSVPNPPAGRYSQAYLEKENVVFTKKYTFTNRLLATIAENIEIVHYQIEHGGRRPRLNKVDR